MNKQPQTKHSNQDQSDRSSTSLATYAQLAAGMAMFGSGTPISKLVTSAFPVFIASGLRVVIATVVLLPFIYQERKTIQHYQRKDWIVIFLIALIGMFLFSIFMLYGMKQISGVVGSIVMSTTPAVTALGSFLLFRDRLGWRKSAAIALAVFGVLILNLGSQQGGQSGGNQFIGMLLIFAAVCSEACYTLLGKKASDHVSPVMIAALAAAIAILLFLPFALYQFSSFTMQQVAWTDWLALAWWGAGTLALGSVLWYRGVAKVAGSTAAGFMGVMPVSALVLSYVLLGEPFAWIHLLGFAAVFAGVLLIAREHAHMH
ncbi:MAG: DMT family transporter [Elainellaceae cyanobacterium]